MKKILFFTIMGSVLCAMTLLLGSCSKDPRVDPREEPIMPTELGQRPVYLCIINKSSLPDNRIMLHFDQVCSHVDGYCYYDPKNNVEQDNDANPVNNDGWKPMRRNQWISLSMAKNYKKERNQANFFFRGSDLSAWYQDILISIDRNDQEKFRIVGTSQANTPGEINVLLARWWNPNQKVRLSCSRVEVGKSKKDIWSVFVDIEVWDY